MFNKLIIYSVLILILPLGLNANCISKLLYISPYQSELPANPMLLLLVDKDMEQFIQDSLHKYPIIMVSETDTIKLFLTERHKNEFNSIQYLAKTERSLIEGLKYHAEIYSRNEEYLSYEYRFHIVITPRNHEWQVKGSIKIETPKFLSRPKKIDGTYTNFGRPEVFDTFEIISNDNIYNLVEINVKRGDFELISYSSISKNKVNVGKGLCFGGYVFKESESYDVSFTLINSNGERSETILLENMTSPSWETESEEFRMYMH